MARSERSPNALAIRTTCCSLVVAAIAICWLPGGNLILFGWFFFLIENLPQVRLRWEGWLLFGLGTALLIALVHYFAIWLARSVSANRSSDGSGSWRWRSSLLLVAAVYAMFGAGLAATGIVHQVGWLATAPSEWYVRRINDDSWSSNARDFRAHSRLLSLGLAMANAESAYGSFPSGTIRSDGKPLHSWVTQSGRFLVLQLPHDPNKSWLHEDNVGLFRKPMLAVLNPGLDATPVLNAEGFALSHYAGNSRVLKVGTKTRNLPGSTLLIGEVNSHFKAWGDPTNLRDPWLGLNRHPNGFGGPAHRRSVMFALADGSVQEINQDIDAKVLQRLSVGK